MTAVNGKVSLVNLILPASMDIYPPIGIMSIAAALRQRGITVSLLHERATKRNMDFILEKSKGSLFTGLSVITGKSLIYNLELSSLLKANGIPVVWGGIHPTFLPECTLKDDSVDFIIMGEGEECICELANKLINTEDFTNIKGLGYRKNGKIFLNERAPLIDNLDTYKVNWDDISIPDYLRQVDATQKFMSYLTSRGCPHRCGFCYNLDFNNRRWRAKSVGEVVADILYLKDRYKFDGIDFIDDNFFTDKKRAFAVAEGIEMFWMAEVRADYVTEDFIRKCKRYNCYKLIIGCESGSNNVLNLIQKDTTTDQIENAISLCYKYDIKVYCSFMIMLPGESNEDRDKTIDFVNRLMNKYRDIEIDGPKIYTPYPGTPLYKISKAKGWKEPNNLVQWSRYHRSMNPSLLGYVKTADIKKYKVLLGAIAVNRDVRAKRKSVSRNSGKVITFYILGLWKKIAEWRLKKRVVVFPIDIKLYIVLSALVEKIIYFMSRANVQNKKALKWQKVSHS